MENEQNERPDTVWWGQWKAQMAERAHGFGVPEEAPLEATAPAYRVVQVDREVELYTLKEALETIGIAELLSGVLSSPLLPAAKTYVQASARAKISTGLVVYAQPKIDEAGSAVLQKISLETTLGSGNGSDLLVVVAKTGARLELVHELVGGAPASVFARLVVVVCEDDARVMLREQSRDSRGEISFEQVGLVGPHGACNFSREFASRGVVKLRSELALIGEKANGTIEDNSTVFEGGALTVEGDLRALGDGARGNRRARIIVERGGRLYDALRISESDVKILAHEGAKVDVEGEAEILSEGEDEKFLAT